MLAAVRLPSTSFLLPPSVPCGVLFLVFTQEKALRKANSRTDAEDDIAFEREWVKVDKKSTEVNALADELATRFQRTNEHGGMVRRATTQGPPTSTTGAQPSAPTSAMHIASDRRGDPTCQATLIRASLCSQPQQLRDHGSSKGLECGQRSFVRQLGHFSTLRSRPAVT
ncbi:hypothetical protein BDV97DRAFT_366695 [Delphinella strobiligena]|nr:hypothetical protein BDV97DRAFT_366695 [Delphinella strobiligena]